MSETRLAVDELRELAERRLRQEGLDADDAKIVVDEHIEAEMRGRDSHGLVLLPTQVERMSKRRGNFEIASDSGAIVIIDGGDMLGPPVAQRAMNIAVERAKKLGVGIVGVRNEFTFVLAGYHPRRVARMGLIAIASSVAVARVAPFGGAEAVLGTNPIAVAVPGGDEPFVLDMAITKIPAADLRLAKAEGRQIPDGCAVDAEGNPTTDPQAALSGAMLPFGDYKGSGLGIAIELLGGALLNVKSGKSETKRRGMLFAVLDPKFFGDSTEILNRFEQTLADIRQSKAMEGFERVIIPGERGEERLREFRHSGIPVSQKILDFLGQ